MTFTTHASNRAAQRNIDPRLADLLKIFGKKIKGCHDRYILEEQFIAKEVIKDASPALKAHIQKQLPIIGVLSDDKETVITLFKPTEKLRWKRKSHFCQAL